MRTDGVVIEFDGLCGTIKSTEGINCLCLKKNFNYEDIKSGDKVTFILEEIKTPTSKKFVAYFIEKV